MLYVRPFIVVSVKCFGLILKGRTLGCDHSALKLVFGVLFLFLGGYQLKANYRNRILLACCDYSRFICFGLGFCASGLPWSETLANGSSSIEFRFACLSDQGEPGCFLGIFLPYFSVFVFGLAGVAWSCLWLFAVLWLFRVIWGFGVLGTSGGLLVSGAAWGCRGCVRFLGLPLVSWASWGGLGLLRLDL